MRVIVTAATTGEWMPCFSKIDKLYTEDSKRLKITFHQSGVGMLATTFSLTKLLMEDKPDMIIQIGIAGCFDDTIKLGRVFLIENEIAADIGVEEKNKWKDIFNLKLERSNYPPYKKRTLPNEHIEKFNLLNMKTVTGLTVNEITTRKERIKQLLKKYAPVTESMEGAALHYVCRAMNVPFLQMRAVSNYIGERDKSKWMMGESLHNLNKTLLQYIDKLYKEA